jgi:serine/threonine-protein kinase
MTRITDTLVLPPDVDLTPVTALSATVRSAIGASDSDWAVTRPGSRTPSRVIDADLADLLALFREGSTIAEAVADYAYVHDADAAEVLTAALPSLEAFIASHWLVRAGEPRSAAIRQTLAIGSDVDGLEVIDCRRVVEDSELYLARDGEGREWAVKLMPDEPRARRLIAREAAVLRHVGGRPAPAVRSEGIHEGRPYLALEWIDGVGSHVRANELLEAGAEPGALLELCIEIVRAYAELHERGVLHGDVHPGNVLVAADGSVGVVDFGLGTAVDSGASHHGGVAYYFDPQHAAAELGRGDGGPLTPAAEQYSVAALVYFLLTGRHHYDFSAERMTALEQIADDDPLDLADRGVAEPVAAVVMRGLGRFPEDRHASMRAFADELERAARHPSSQRAPVPRRDPSDGDEYVARQLDWVRAGGPGAVANAPGPHGSIMFGSAGIALGLLRMAGARDDPGLLGDAVDWTDAALAALDRPDSFADVTLDIDEGNVGEISPFHTASGVHLVAALVGQSTGDVTAVRSGLEGFLQATDRAADNLDLTIGRSSVVLGCLQLMEACDRLPAEYRLPDAGDRLRERGAAVLTEVWARLDGDHPGRANTAVPYLGISHGWAGLAYADLLWSATTGVAPSDAALDVLERLSALAELSDGRARWPITTRDRGREHNYMTSWCNGAPGFVFLWDTAFEQSGDARFADLAEAAARETMAARDHVGSLCCGYAGRSYALARHWRATGRTEWLDRAGHLAELARQTPSSGLAHSLYKGEWGAAVLTAELGRPEQARLPLFELDVGSTA